MGRAPPRAPAVAAAGRVAEAAAALEL
jgi:hypothetical protein